MDHYGEFESGEVNNGGGYVDMEIDAALVLAKKIKLRTIHGVILATDLQVYECEEPYVLIFLFTTEMNDEIRLDIFKDDLSKELKLWLEGKYLRNPAILVPTRVEESIMHFIKFAKTPKQEDLILWILSRCEFYPAHHRIGLGGGKERVPAGFLFGGKAVELSKEETKTLQQKLSTIQQTITQNRFPKTAAIASARQNTSSKDDSQLSNHPGFDESANTYREGNTRQSRSLQRSHSTNRSLSAGPGTTGGGGRGLKTTSLDLNAHDKEIFQTHDDLGMFQLTKQLLGKSQTLTEMNKQKVKNRIGASTVVNTQHFTNDHWRLYNEITRARKEISENLNQRRKLIEIAKTRQLQKTIKLQTIKTMIKEAKGANQFIEKANNELSVLQQMQTNIQDDLKQQKIKIIRGTQKVLWTMAPNYFSNLRGKSQKGPLLGPGPLPPNATTDLKDPAIELTSRKYYWDTAGRRHLKQQGIEYDHNEESLMEQAMNAIRRLAQNISAYKLDLKAVFEKFDTSGDGFLSQQEMAEAFLHMGVKLDIPTMQAIFDHFDPNHSGSVHYGEFVWAFFNRRKIVRQWKQKTKGLTIHQIQNMFHEFDLNGNGSLSYKEFARLLKQVFHMNLSEQEVNTLINQFDINQDGEIDIQEFLIFIQSEQQNFDEVANNPHIPAIAKHKKSITSSGNPPPLPPRPSSAPRKRQSTASPPPPPASADHWQASSLRPRAETTDGRRIAGTASEHNRTAPGILEAHRIHSSKKKAVTLPYEDTIAEEDGEDDYDGQATTAEIIEKKLAQAKAKLHQTDSQIHQLQRHNREIVKENQQPLQNQKQQQSRNQPPQPLILPPESDQGAAPDYSVVVSEKQRQRIDRLLNEAPPAVPSSLSQGSSNPSATVDVVWVARMLQAQAEIESRLGRRYYKNNA